MQYILRIGPYRPRSQREDGLQTRFADLVASGFGNLPRWANEDPVFFFATSDQCERENGTSFRPIHFSLPRIGLEALNAIVERVCSNLFCCERHHAFVWSIHNPKAAFEGNDHPHAHLTFCERLIDDRELDPVRYFSRFNRKNPNRGGYLKFGWELTSSQRRDHLNWIRKTIADEINREMERLGLSDRVSSLRFEQIGINRIPEHYYSSGRKNTGAVIATRQLRNEIDSIDAILLRERNELRTLPAINFLAKRRKDRRDVNLIEATSAADVRLDREPRFTREERGAGLWHEKPVRADRVLDLDKTFGMLRPVRPVRVELENEKSEENSERFDESE